MRLVELVNVLDFDQYIAVVYELDAELRLVITDGSVENLAGLLTYGLIHPFLYVTCVLVDGDDVMNIYVRKELPENE